MGGGQISGRMALMEAGEGRWALFKGREEGEDGVELPGVSWTGRWTMGMSMGI